MTNEYSQLVTLLRSLQGSACDKAADAIEALAAECVRLKTSWSTMVQVSNQTADLNDKLAAELKQIRSQEPVHPVQLHSDVKAALCLALYHHQGGSSTVGQPIRKILGMGQHDEMTHEQYWLAKKVKLGINGYEVAQPVRELTADDIRKAGGIVRSDGNIFSPT